MSIADWIVFSILLLSILSFGIFKSGQVNTRNLYLLAGRKTKLFPLVATLVMTEFNTATLIAFSSFGYHIGWRALSLPCVFLVGLLFYALTVAKKWKEFNGLSVADFFLERYGKDVGITVRIILFVAMAGFSATYVKSLTLIFTLLFPAIDYWMLSALLSLIILLTVWRGGLMSIIRTDMISFVIVLLFFPLLLHHVWRLSPVFHAYSARTLAPVQQILSVRFVISLIFLTMFSYILAPWYGQKITSAESSKTAVLAVTIAALLVFLLYGCAVMTTVFLADKNIILAQADQALPYVIHSFASPGLQGVGYAVLFLAAATTLSGVWSAMVTLLIHGRNNQTGTGDEMVLTGICAFISYFLANIFSGQIMNNMILANIPVVALSFSLLAGFYWRKASKLGVYASILTGMIWGVACYYYYGERHIYTWYWAIYGIPLIFIAGSIGSLITKPKKTGSRGTKSNSNNKEFLC